MAQKRKPPKPRDPYWRTRQALTPKRKESAKSYRRGESRQAELEELREPAGNGPASEKEG